MTGDATITFTQIREKLYSAVICDALDSIGYRRQSPDGPFHQYSSSSILVGRCKTTLWAEMFHEDPKPYELELSAVDSCQPDDVFIAAAGGSRRSGVWGELLTTAARMRGCVGAIVDGAVRDVEKIQRIGFPVIARATSVYDSMNRQRVIDVDIPVEIGGVVFSPGALVFADMDGIVVVPPSVEDEVLRRAWRKVHAEDQVRDAIRGGLSATDAYDKYGIL